MKQYAVTFNSSRGNKFDYIEHSIDSMMLLDSGVMSFSKLVCPEFWAMTRIHNQSQQTVQLLRRHWIITNGFGEVEHVKGDGVIGKQPILHPNEEHEYISGCPLPTSMGSMKGSYQMRNEKGELFDVFIPEFLLAAPESYE